MSPQKVEQIYNTTIIGGPNIVASGSDNIISGFEQVAGDLSSLKDALARLGLQDSDIGALQSAIDQDGEEPPPGPAVKSWLGGIKDRVSSGSLVLAGNASGSMITAIAVNMSPSIPNTASAASTSRPPLAFRHEAERGS